VAAFLLLTTCNTYGQPEVIQFKHLTSDDGLSSSEVTSILQDFRGYIWIGTYRGINRYDGTKVVIYKNIPSDTSRHIIDVSVAKTIFEDREKNLYVGTFEGLS